MRKNCANVPISCEAGGDRAQDSSITRLLEGGGLLRDSFPAIFHAKARATSAS